ncbi:complex I subunit 4 family protein [Actomonas aquatica]|uniref:NADH-quinone oxidoreductase subunit M n=1 Tax=Actomonas aquatica TaxID=2866162 RepID=A0ABZ1C5F0_9BACT|nr:NADH-quinone oxidoreductase subunit M [Opitutus sp. WL0086]WRQ86839.1 NADH-quinone oxidoreductase subunit M [Opitutus sp. WL0086]
MQSFDILLFAIMSPLALALAMALGLPEGLGKKLAYVAFALPALAGLCAWYRFAGAPTEGGYAFLTSYNTGLSNMGIQLTLGLNGISLPLFVMAGLVGLAAGLYALQSAAERLNTYIMLLLIMQGGLMGVFASVDVFFFYFFHELALIPTFIMVGIWGGRDRNYAAMKMTIYLTVGAMLSLIGLIAIYYQSGAKTFDMIALRAAIAEHGLSTVAQQNIFGLLMFGFGVLVSLWPLHTWAPLGYGAAPSSVAMLHAGVLKKFGLYGLIQVALPLLPQGASHWATILAVLAVVGNVVVVGIITIAQKDLKQLVGYSSVMHMGYAFLGIACISTIGIGGVVFMMVAHGFSAALLFLLSTSIYHRTQTFDLDEMGGLVKHAPVLSAFFVAATLASIGLPGFANFWGELTIFVAAWKSFPTLTVLSVTGIIISAIYGLRAAAKVFFGPQTEAFDKVLAEKPATDLNWAEKLPALLLLAGLLVFGFWPKAFTAPINDSVTEIYAAAAAVTPTDADVARN